MDLPKTKKDQELFLKKIYDYCTRVKWQKEKLDELAREINVHRSIIREWARKYAKEHFTPEEYKEIDKQINELTILDRNTTKLKLSKQNPILFQTSGKITYQLWETKEEKEYVLKYIFDYCDKNNFNKQIIKSFAEWLGTTVTKIEEYYKQYTLEYLRWTPAQCHAKRMEYVQYNRKNTYKIRETNSKKIYEQLLNVTSLEDITKIINSSNLNIETIKNSITDYVVVHHEGNQDIKQTLKSKIKMYTDYMATQNEEEKQKNKELEQEKIRQAQLPIAIATIMAFINNNNCDTIDIFCKKNNITKNIFLNYIELIKELDKTLFKKYDLKITVKQNETHSIITNQIKQIITYLKTGIKQHGIIRPFDLIDYYLLTKISLKDILTISKDIITTNEFSLLKKFVTQNIEGNNHNPNVINQIMSETVIINYQKDKKGNPIPGTEEIFSNEEKQKIINFLNQEQIPLNLKTYNIAYRRYRNGTIDLNITNKVKQQIR